ncbi:DUF1456 family protein [Sporosarcina pasteurii]|uniref:Protein of uncharacterized function (DUF1456) n=1 Tax=Sporosarcina pasteurii TaxID=1474 RepID=A0A380BYQ1_SPOPA|nr:DUF1456 family protein [Sporosarcina pasteurii]MDS9471388.1 DUF1456 family protein [Sporosarcina pasteurii]QBQ04984.1 DUF1456 family protein [Sporosarcina pasteurii]SUJ08552.1 Protein of uncharacterised function (DUF1456) [Sporosarcina pasteurii]
MNNNDVLIRLRYALDLKNAEMVEVFKLGDCEVAIQDIPLLLAKEDEEYLECTNAMLDSFLNGLIIFKRGRQEPQPGQPKRPPLPVLNDDNVNNIILKKLRIALTLTSDDIIEILDDAGVRISKSELSAVLRREDHRNYNVCGDRYVRNFLKGLAMKYRG